MSENHKDQLPFLISGTFKKACRGCPALDVKAEILRGQNEAGQEAVYLVLECYNAEVCRAIEARPREEMQLCAGGTVWFANGQTGTIREISLVGSGAEPVLRCVKSLGGVTYEVEYQASQIGSSIFLSSDALMKHRQSSEEGSGNEEYADRSQ